MYLMMIWRWLCPFRLLLLKVSGRHWLLPQTMRHDILFAYQSRPCLPGTIGGEHFLSTSLFIHPDTHLDSNTWAPDDTFITSHRCSVSVEIFCRGIFPSTLPFSILQIRKWDYLFVARVQLWSRRVFEKQRLSCLTHTSLRQVYADVTSLPRF